MLSPRINYSLTFDYGKKEFYLFGGVLHDHCGRERWLDDMYLFKVVELDGDRKKEAKRVRGRV